MSWGRWVLYGVLAASLAFNFFVLGVWVTRVREGFDGPPPPTSELSNFGTLRSFYRQLPDDKRQELRQELRGQWREARPALRELGQARRELVGLLNAAEVSEAELRAAYDRLRAADTQMRQPLYDSLAKTIAKLDQQQRQQAIQSLGAQRRARREGGAEGLPPPDQDFGPGQGFGQEPRRRLTPEMRERLRQRFQERRRQLDMAPETDPPATAQ